jgi:hypothetical protein
MQDGVDAAQQAAHELEEEMQALMTRKIKVRVC